MSANASGTPKENAKRVLELQRGWTKEKEERKIEEIFLGTEGSDLTELKDRIDYGDDHYDLQQLLYHDIDKRKRRQQIIKHIRTQSKDVRDKAGRRGIKVVSDIDDTIYPNYADSRPWNLEEQPYPGIVEFYEAIAGTPASGTSNIVLISARPYERTGRLEQHGTRQLRDMDFPSHATLSGDLWTVAAGVNDLFRGRIRRLGKVAIRKIGERKFKNLVQWIGLMGEYDVIISGDRTQADHDFAYEALTHSECKKRVLAGFIHDVGDREKCHHEAPVL